MEIAKATFDLSSRQGLEQTGKFVLERFEVKLLPPSTIYPGSLFLLARTGHPFHEPGERLILFDEQLTEAGIDPQRAMHDVEDPRIVENKVTQGPFWGNEAGSTAFAFITQVLLFEDLIS